MTTSYMAKIFSPLAAARMHFWDDNNHDRAQYPNAHLFCIDELAAEHNLGPKIYATVDTKKAPALLMQDCPGNVLTEQDLNENVNVVRLAASALARLCEYCN